MDLSLIKSELDSDPLGRGYAGMTNQQIADDLNAVTHDGAADVQGLRQYLLTTKFRTRIIYGAIAYVARQQIGAVIPFGDNGVDVTLIDDHVTSAIAMIAIAETADSERLIVTDATVKTILDDLALGSGCHCISGTIKAAIEAFSENQQSRGEQIGVGRGVTVGHIEAAKAL